MSLNAQTNELDFRDPTLACAWDDIGLVRLNSNGELVIPNEKAGIARLMIFQKMFMPHPFNNLYENILMDMQVEAEDCRVEFHMYREREKPKKRAWFFVGLGAGFLAGLLPPVLISAYK